MCTMEHGTIEFKHDINGSLEFGTKDPKRKHGYTIEECGCWEYQGIVDKHGYPFLSVYRYKNRTKPTSVFAYRYYFELWVGEIPEGMELDHLCNNPLCINPEHLEPTTRAENMRRAAERRTHCKHGHEHSVHGFMFWGTRKRRECKACYKNRLAKHAKQRREETKRQQEARRGTKRLKRIKTT